MSPQLEEAGERARERGDCDVSWSSPPAQQSKGGGGGGGFETQSGSTMGKEERASLRERGKRFKLKWPTNWSPDF